MLREKGVRAHWDTTLPLLSPLTASRRLVTSPPPPQQPLLPRLPSEDDTQTWTASLISPSPNPSPWDVLLGTCLEVTDPLKAAVEVRLSFMLTFLIWSGSVSYSVTHTFPRSSVLHIHTNTHILIIEYVRTVTHVDVQLFIFMLFWHFIPEGEQLKDALVSHLLNPQLASNSLCHLYLRLPSALSLCFSLLC